MIDQNTQFGQCSFIRRKGLSLTIEDKTCDGFSHATMQIICIRNAPPATRLAEILDKHLETTERFSTAMNARGITVDNNRIPDDINSMARTLSDRPKKEGLIWSIEVMALIH